MRPIQPRFQVVDDANAGEPGASRTMVASSITSSSLPPPDTGQPPSNPPLSAVQPKVVRLPGNSIQSNDLTSDTGTPDSGQPPPSQAVETLAPRAREPLQSPSMPFHVGPSIPAPAAPVIEQAASGGQGWYIQAGSFASKDNASALAGRLKAVGQTETTAVQANGKTWQRVRVGPFDSRRTAQEPLPQAKEQGATGAWIVKE